MKQIPRWASVSSSLAPVFLIGGWSLAQAKQPASYDPIRDTISALAAHGANDRWIMTSALVGVGVCHVATACGLSPASNVSRMIFAGGGAATVLVAAFPQPASGNSVAHTIAATCAFIALAAWPAFSNTPRTKAPLLQRKASTAATIGLLGLVAWFAAELHGGERGLAERAAAGAQALWPLAVVFSTKRFIRTTR